MMHEKRLTLNLYLKVLSVLFTLSLLSGLGLFIDNVMFLFLLNSLVLIFSILASPSAVSPGVLFSIFCYFYTISFPVLAVFTEEYTVGNQALLIILRAGLLMNTAFLMSSWSYSNPKFEGFHSSFGNKCSNFILSLIFSFFLINAIYLSIELSGDKTSLQGELSFIGAFVYWFLCFVFLFFVSSKLADKKIGVCLFLLIFIIYYLFLGERDIVVRAGLLVLIYMFYKNEISNGPVFLVYFSAILLNPLSQILKGFFSYGSEASLNWSLIDVFRGEFMSQGRNFYWLIDSSEKIESILGNMITNDIFRFINLSQASTGLIFNQNFMNREPGSSGLGFTLLGELFFSGGYLPIVVVGLILGGGVKWIYLKSFSSEYFLFLYVTTLFTISYSLRADVANLLSGVIKLGLAPILVAWLLSVFINQFNLKRA